MVTGLDASSTFVSAYFIYFNASLWSGEACILCQYFYLIFKVSLAYCLIFGIQGYVPAYGVEGAFIAHLTVQWALLVVYYLIFLEKQLRVHWSGQFFHFKTLLKI